MYGQNVVEEGKEKFRVVNNLWTIVIVILYFSILKIEESIKEVVLKKIKAYIIYTYIYVFLLNSKLAHTQISLLNIYNKIIEIKLLNSLEM